MKKGLFAFAFTALFLSPAAFSQGAVKKPITLVIDHKTMEVFIEETGQPRDLRLLSKEEKDIREIKNDEEMTIVLRHQNPILYEYTWKGLKKEKTEDYQAALKLAEMLKEAILPFLPEEVDKNIDKAFSGVLKEKLETKKYKELFASVRELLDYADLIPSLIAASLGSDAEVEEKKKEVRNWPLDKLEKDIGNLYAQVDKYQVDYIRNRSIVSIGKIISYGPTSEDQVDVQLMLFAKDQQPNILKVVESVKAFARAFLRINETVVLDKAAFSGSEFASGALEIKAADQAPRDNSLMKDVINGHIGTYSFMIEPSSPARFTIKPALVYSYARNEDGTRVGWVTPVVFGIIPKALDHPIFGGEIQLGILLESEKQGFFIGAGLKIYDRIFLGGGATYQQVAKDKYVWSGYLNLAYDLK
jgi:hypothetical protein